MQTKESNQSRRFKTIMIGIGLMIGMATVTGIAIAAWTVGGEGGASGKAISAGDIKKIKIVEITPEADMIPGQTSPAHFNVVNENNFKVALSGLTFDFGEATSNKDGCAGSNLTKAGESHTISFKEPIIIPANASAEDPAGPFKSDVDAFKLAADAPEACQGAVFTVPVTGVKATTAA